MEDVQPYTEGIKITEDAKNIDIFGDIVAGWSNDLAYVTGRLQGRTDQIRVRVNSGGGDLFQGMAIASMLNDYPGKVVADVMGLAASAASALLAGADVVRMYRGSFLMIHNPWSYVVGDADVMRKAGDGLEVMQDELAKVYVGMIMQRKGGDPAQVYAQVIQWMNNETWFSPDDAVAVGLADQIIGKSESISSFAIQASGKYSTFQKTPERVKNLIMATTKAKQSAGPISSFVAGMRKLLNQIEVEPVQETPTEDEGIVITMSADEMIAALEELGYTVTKTETEPEAAMDEDEEKMAAMDEEEIQNRIEAAVKAAMDRHTQNKKAATPVSAKVQTKAAYNRAEQIRANKGRQFDAFAKLVNNK